MKQGTTTFLHKKITSMHIPVSYSMASSDYSVNPFDLMQALASLLAKFDCVISHSVDIVFVTRLCCLFCVYSLCCKLLWFQFYVLVGRIIIFFPKVPYFMALS